MYQFDPFKKETSKKYYTGNVHCGDCRAKFKTKDIKIRTWKEVISAKEDTGDKK